MIRSMTGYGLGEEATEQYKLTVEIKAVNHRYCDISIRLPRKFYAFENAIRNLLTEHVSRGKIDIFIKYEETAGNQARVCYHKDIACGYMDAAQQAAQEFDIPLGATGSSLLRFPEVVTLEEGEADASLMYPVLQKVLGQAIDNFQAAKEQEGEHLKKDILEKLALLDSHVDFVEERYPDLVQEHRQKLMDKVQELLGDRQIDETVLATEITVFADRICVDEETVRLRSHINTMREVLESREAVGRKLDFIAQEMNREANTILSKVNDIALSNRAIDLKTEIEKIREQIQNIE